MSSDFAVSLCGPDERLEFCVGWLWILDFAVSSSFCNDCSGFCPSARKQQKIRNTEFRIQSLSPTGFRLPKLSLKKITQVFDFKSGTGLWILDSGFCHVDFAAWLRSRLAHPAPYTTLSREVRGSAAPPARAHCDELFILCGERRAALTQDQRMSRTRTNGRDASTTRMQRAGRCYSDRAAAMCHAPRRVCTWTCPTRCAPTACMFVCLVCLVARCLRAVQHESSYSCERSERAAASLQLVQP